MFGGMDIHAADLKEISKKVFDSDVMNNLFKTSTKANQEVFKTILSRVKELEELALLIGTNLPEYMVSSLIKSMVSLKNIKCDIYLEVEYLIKKCIKHTEKRRIKNQENNEMNQLQVNDSTPTQNHRRSFSNETAV